MTHSIRVFLSGVILLCSVVVAPTSLAAPVAETERIPVDLRRATLVVRDIDKSLPLYRDALGMKVIYDQVIGGVTRLVLLRANDDFVGVLGLMQRLNTTDAVPSPEYRKARAGELILVFNVKDLDVRWEKIRSAPHVVVAESPRRIDYPGAGGSVIPVTLSAVWAADGNFIEMNRLMGAPAGVNR